MPLRSEREAGPFVETRRMGALEEEVADSYEGGASGGKEDAMVGVLLKVVLRW